MLIDFEQRFSEYLDTFIHENHIDEDSMEDIVPDLYLEWLDTPQSWLNGVSPNEHFSSMGAVTLITALGQYMLSDITLPGPLLNRISDNRKETYPLLVALLKNYTGENEDKIRTVVVHLLEEMDMAHPYDYYIEAISQSAEQSDFSEACADELRDAGPEYLEPVICAFEQAQHPYATDCFLDILTDMPYDERTYGYVIERFLLSDTQKAFYANCLGKIGNPKALPALEEALRQEDMRYFDYIAIRNALEELGGEVDIERDFTGDNDYESLIDLERKH